MTKLFNRLTALSLVIFLALTGSFAAHAEGTDQGSAAQNITLFTGPIDSNTPGAAERKYPIAVTAMGDSLYILTDYTLERWTPGLLEPMTVLSELPGPKNQADLLSDGTRLFALDIMEGELWALADGTEGFVPSLVSDLEWEAIFPANLLGYPLLLDGILYLSASYDGPTDAELHRWDIETGKALPAWDISYIDSMAPYQEDQLLVAWNTFEMDGWSETSLLGTMDLTTGELTVLFDLDTDVCGLCYNPDTDTVYYASGEIVYRQEGLRLLNPQVSAYMPSVCYQDSNMGILSGTMYYTADYDSGVAVRVLDPKVE